MARRTKLTPDIIEQAVELWKKGYMQKEIYGALGIDERTWFRWLEAGRDGKQPYAALVKAFEQARIERRIELVSKIQAAADKNWVCAAWILEREYPELYSRPELRLRHYDEPVEIVDEPIELADRGRGGPRVMY